MREIMDRPLDHKRFLHAGMAEPGSQRSVRDYGCETDQESPGKTSPMAIEAFCCVAHEGQCNPFGYDCRFIIGGASHGKRTYVAAWADELGIVPGDMGEHAPWTVVNQIKLTTEEPAPMWSYQSHLLSKYRQPLSSSKVVQMPQRRKPSLPTLMLNRLPTRLWLLGLWLRLLGLLLLTLTKGHQALKASSQLFARSLARCAATSATFMRTTCHGRKRRN